MFAEIGVIANNYLGGISYLIGLPPLPGTSLHGQPSRTTKRKAIAENDPLRTPTDEREADASAGRRQTGDAEEGPDHHSDRARSAEQRAAGA